MQTVGLILNLLPHLPFLYLDGSQYLFRCTFTAETVTDLVFVLNQITSLCIFLPKKVVESCPFATTLENSSNSRNLACLGRTQ